jgi:hypothetical protein
LPVLIWQSDTRTMNPRISQEFIDEQIDLDPEAGRSEWGGLFREDISMAFPLELIEQCIGAIHVALLGKVFDPRAVPIGVGNRTFAAEAARLFGSTMGSEARNYDVDDDGREHVGARLAYTRWLK